MKTGILVIGNKDCQNYPAFAEFMHQCIDIWKIEKENLHFVTEDKRNVAQFLYNFIQDEKGITYNQFSDVAVDWNEYGKVAGLVKNKELLKIVTRNTSPKSISKIIVFLDSPKPIEEIIKGDKWNLKYLIDEAIVERNFQLFLFHTFTSALLSGRKEIEEIEDPVEKSARLLAQAMKGKVIDSDSNSTALELAYEKNSPTYNFFDEFTEEDEEKFDNLDNIPF